MKMIELPTFQAFKEIKREYTGFYTESKSRIDGSPIVTIITLGSNNRKTADLMQMYILASKQNPLDTYSQGLDKGICGNCIHRWSLGGDCYVNLNHGPMQVYKAWERGRYKKIDWRFKVNALALQHKNLRFGAYGDPAALSKSFYNKLFKYVNPSKYTAYTHQWKQSKFTFLKTFCMASVDSLEEKRYANSLGFRTFRIIYDCDLIDDEIVYEPDEFACPAAEEQGKRLTCAECFACNGAPKGLVKGNVGIRVHGNRTNKQRDISEMLRKLQNV